MKFRIIWFAFLIFFCLDLTVQLGCASLQRRGQEALDRASIPVYKESATTELSITNSRIATAETWLSSGDAVKESLHLSDKSYAKVKDEAEANLAYLKARKSLLEAAIPTLPPRPAPVPPNSSPTPSHSNVGTVVDVPFVAQ